MGRTVIAEDLLQDRIQEILKTSGKGITTGLLVGQPHGQKREDYVVHLIRTPQIEEDSQQAGKKKKKGSTKPEGLDSQWIAEHAKQDSGTVAEWKFQSFVSQWPLLHTAVTVNINIPVLRGEATKTLHQQLDTSIGPFCECIMQGLCTFNGVLRKGDQPLQAQEPPQSKKGHGKGKGRHKESKTSHQPTSDGPEMFCVQILSKAAIREDVVRSLTARCELLAEDVLEVKDFTADREEMDITPRRVFGRLYDTHLSVCDYMFEDEGVEDCIARCQELLDIPLAPDDVENDAERLPAFTALSTAVCKACLSASNVCKVSSGNSSNIPEGPQNI
uniref:Protein odr-4 homolog n=1 Tax=Branchiostoma floridae TaxID=7739 RepID=C3ZCK3_BRAFL|eukprot:XP_002593696.1 hypothetical protein BRAFLDRAFT_107676 [Branchiostoma floridae]